MNLDKIDNYLNEKEDDYIKYMNVVKIFADEALRYYAFGDMKQAKANIASIQRTLDKLKKVKI